MSFLNVSSKLFVKTKPFVLACCRSYSQRNIKLPSTAKCVVKSCMPSKMDVVGKNIVLTGGACGIMHETAKEIVRNGACKVAILDMVDAEENFKEFRCDYPCNDITIMQTDVSNKDQVECAFRQIMDRWNQIDMVFNGAGILDECQLERCVSVNVIGSMYVTLTAMEHMSKSKCGNGGVIINVASVFGLDTFFSIPINTATKHAIVGFTQALSNEFYKQLTGIEFITICPGITETKMMSNLPDKVIYPEARGPTLDLMKQLPIQDSCSCAKNFLKVLKDSSNGSIWILDNSRFYEVVKTKYWLWEK